MSRFFSDIEEWLPAYNAASSFGYVALVEDNALIVRAGRLLLNTAPSDHERGFLRSTSIVAGHVDLTVLGLSPAEFLKQLTIEGIETSGGRLHLPPDGDAYSSFYLPIQGDRLSPTSNRVSMLYITGRRQVQMPPPHVVDWELRAASPPFDSEQELAVHFGAGIAQGDACSIEVLASEVTRLHDSSRVANGVATVRACLAKGLSPEKFSLGYRVLSHGRPSTRGVLRAENLTWSDLSGILVAQAEVPVEPQQSIHCFARYAGVCHHHQSFADPSNSHNALREMYGLFDDGMRHLSAFLKQEGKSDQNDFEAGVSFLLWMLGFQIVLMGGTPKTKEAPDLIAVTPSGDVLVVECTTGLLKAQDKMAKVFERAGRVRRRLDASGNSSRRVLSVEVTALVKEDLKVEFEAARTQGIVVLAQEDLLGMLERTTLHADADAFFATLWSSAHAPVSASWHLHD